MSERHVLVVEDNPLNMVLVHDVLEMNGWTVHEATSVPEALRALQACEQLDAVLADISLDDEDQGGERVLKAVRDDSRHQGVTVVALTAFAMRGDRERFLREGFDGYISKPIDVASFAGTVEGICGQDGG